MDTPKWVKVNHVWHNINYTPKGKSKFVDTGLCFDCSNETPIGDLINNSCSYCRKREEFNNDDYDLYEHDNINYYDRRF
jgi:hypothetical protein